MSPNLDNPQGPSTSDIVHSEFHELYLGKKKKKAGNLSFSDLFSAPWEPTLNTPIGSIALSQNFYYSN